MSVTPSSDIMSLEGVPLPLRQVVTAWGCGVGWWHSEVFGEQMYEPWFYTHTHMSPRLRPQKDGIFNSKQSVTYKQGQIITLLQEQPDK